GRIVGCKHQRHLAGDHGIQARHRLWYGVSPSVHHSVEIADHPAVLRQQRQGSVDELDLVDGGHEAAPPETSVAVMDSPALRQSRSRMRSKSSPRTHASAAAVSNGRENPKVTGHGRLWSDTIAFR